MVNEKCEPREDWLTELVELVALGHQLIDHK